MSRTDTLLASYRGLVNTVCRAARLFGAMADLLHHDGVLTRDDASDYVLAARDWAMSYDDMTDLSVYIALG